MIPEFDAETYLLWESRQPEKFELHFGFIVAFAGGSLDHDRIAFNIRTGLERLFPAPCRSFGSDVKVQVAHRTFYYPDASVGCDERSGTDVAITSPIVVAEVLSPSTRAYDLIDKRAAYRQLESLIVYLVAHTDFRRVDVDLRRADRSWYTVSFDDGVLPIGDDTLSLEAIYARTSVP